MKRLIRNSAKGIVIMNDCLLATKIKDGDDVFYIMPGGGQDVGETLEAAAEREILEEFGFEVKAKSLEFVVEGVTGERFHRVDLVFLCEFIREVPGSEIKGDHNQVGFDWLPIESLMDAPLYPSRLRQQIINLHLGRATQTYLGDESMEVS